jgi:hypothetical protein
MSPAALDTHRALGLDDTAIHDAVQARFRDAPIEVTGDDLIHEASPEAVPFLESLLPDGLDVLVTGLEKLIKGCGATVRGRLSARRTRGWSYCSPQSSIPLSTSTSSARTLKRSPCCKNRLGDRLAEVVGLGIAPRALEWKDGDRVGGDGPEPRKARIEKRGRRLVEDDPEGRRYRRARRWVRRGPARDHVDYGAGVESADVSRPEQVSILLAERASIASIRASPNSRILKVALGIDHDVRALDVPVDPGSEREEDICSFPAVSNRD